MTRYMCLHLSNILDRNKVNDYVKECSCFSVKYGGKCMYVYVLLHTLSAQRWRGLCMLSANVTNKFSSMQQIL